MHEWALAESVVFSALKFAKEKGTDVKEVVIHLGDLQQIDREVFEFALKEIMKSSGLKFKFSFRREEAVFKCKKCGEEWKFSTKGLKEDKKESIHFLPETIHAFEKCPKCGSPDFIIKKGRGLWISVLGD